MLTLHNIMHRIYPLCRIYLYMDFINRPQKHKLLYALLISAPCPEWMQNRATYRLK